MILSMRKYFFIMLILNYNLLYSDPDFNCIERLEIGRVEEISAGIANNYKKIKDLKGDFSQVSYFSAMDQTLNSKGTVKFLKPGRIDWQYKEGESQRFISNNKTLWFYQPELNQVIVYDFDGTLQNNMPISFLVGAGSIEEAFNPKAGCKTEKGYVVFYDSKHPEGNDISEFRMFVSDKGYLPLAASVLKSNNDITTLILDNVEIDTDLQEKEFEFEIPESTDVIEKH